MAWSWQAWHGNSWSWLGFHNNIPTFGWIFKRFSCSVLFFFWINWEVKNLWMQRVFWQYIKINNIHFIHGVNHYNFSHQKFGTPIGNIWITRQMEKKRNQRILIILQKVSAFVCETSILCISTFEATSERQRFRHIRKLRQNPWIVSPFIFAHRPFLNTLASNLAPSSHFHFLLSVQSLEKRSAHKK